MPFGPCLHIFASFVRVILPSFLSNASSSGDCLTTSHGFFISFSPPIDIEERASEGATAFPLIRIALGAGAAWPFDGGASASEYCRKSRSPFLKPTCCIWTPEISLKALASPPCGWFESFNVERSVVGGMFFAISGIRPPNVCEGSIVRRNCPSRPAQRSVKSQRPGKHQPTSKSEEHHDAARQCGVRGACCFVVLFLEGFGLLG